MALTLALEQITPALALQVGGKAAALAHLERLGYPIPRSLAITTTAYRRYLEETGLDALILMELGRKDFSQMRWEELWDAALRIRSLFLKTALPAALEGELAAAMGGMFGSRPLVIRSSAPGEDSPTASFAGLHNSFVNIRGKKQQLLAVRKVWASLWSDRALLYRQELGLAIHRSAMAVLVQELVAGESSGVAFSCSPTDPGRVAVEAVKGLNQGLVDGSIEPDFWELDRQDQGIVHYRPGDRAGKLVAGGTGLQRVALSAAEQQTPVLTAGEVTRVAATALALERALGQPQDLEWTWQGEQLVLLQARPITTGNSSSSDPRSWYLSLHRGLANLKQLQTRIEQDILPGMEADAAGLATIDLQSLGDEALAGEIERRRQRRNHWEEAYRADCIPMAHGIRLFGEFYNDALAPEDPFEFMELLRGGQFRAVSRNRKLAELATLIRGEQQQLAAGLTQLRQLSEPLALQLREQAEAIGLPAELTLQLLLEMARQPISAAVGGNRELEQRYRRHFCAEERSQAEELLEIGRASYRLRDDDNLSLEKISRELQRAEEEGQRRLLRGEVQILRQVLTPGAGAGRGLSSPALFAGEPSFGVVRARQLQGQPASPGLATATARVIQRPQDLAEFRAGEILVCDAIDPAMTFVVPLAAGIIERRGGMLIHGAIIAREYGIPCVSGIASAAERIRTGDRITLDGYLGLVFFPPDSGRLSPSGPKSALRKELDDAAEG